MATTTDILITKLRDAAYDTGWYAGRIEEMVTNKVDADAVAVYRDLHADAIKKRKAVEEALRRAVSK